MGYRFKGNKTRVMVCACALRLGVAGTGVSEGSPRPAWVRSAPAGGPRAGPWSLRRARRARAHARARARARVRASSSMRNLTSKLTVKSA